MYTMPMEAPDKIYKALYMALEDLKRVKELIKKGRRLVLCTSKWHVPAMLDKSTGAYDCMWEGEGTPDACAVCFAGCVMTRVLPDNIVANYASFGHLWSKVFNALDYCRCFDWNGACRALHGESSVLPVEIRNKLQSLTGCSVYFTTANTDPKFEQEMLKAAEIFEEFDI